MSLISLGSLAAIAVALASVSCAQAAPVEYTFSGQVQNGNLANFPSLNGETFNGTLYVDDNPTSVPTPGTYTASGSDIYVDLVSDGYDLNFSGTEVTTISPDSYTISFNEPAAVTINGGDFPYPLYEADFLLTFSTALSSLDYVLPGSLSVLPTVSVSLADLAADSGQYTSSVRAFAAAVPLPSALPLFGSALAGLAAFGFLGWRRRRDAADAVVA